MAVLDRSRFTRGGWNAAREIAAKRVAEWACVSCQRTFSADQPRYYDAEVGREYDICIDCSH